MAGETGPGPSQDQRHQEPGARSDGVPGRWEGVQNSLATRKRAQVVRIWGQAYGTGQSGGQGGADWRRAGRGRGREAIPLQAGPCRCNPRTLWSALLRPRAGWNREKDPLNRPERRRPWNPPGQGWGH